MPKLPVATGPQIIAALKRARFVFDRQKGSHVTLWHPKKRRSVTVPDHGSKPLRPGTIRCIIRDAGLTVDNFRRLLK